MLRDLARERQEQKRLLSALMPTFAALPACPHYVGLVGQTGHPLDALQSSVLTAAKSGPVDVNADQPTKCVHRTADHLVEDLPRRLAVRLVWHHCEEPAPSGFETLSRRPIMSALFAKTARVIAVAFGGWLGYVLGFFISYYSVDRGDVGSAAALTL